MTRTTRMIYVEEISGNEENEGEKVDMEKVLTPEPDPVSRVNTPKKIPGVLTVSDRVDEKPSPTVPRVRSAHRSLAPIQIPMLNTLKSTNRIGGPKSIAHDDDQKPVEDSLLYPVLKPIFLWMKFSGLFFARRFTPSGAGAIGRIKNCTKLQAYCIAVNVVLTLNFLRSLSAFDGNETFGTEFFFKLLVCIFFYEAASRSALAYNACWCKKYGWHSLFAQIERVCYPDKIIPYENSLRNAVKFFLLLTVIVSLSNMAVLFYGLLGPEDTRALFNNYLAPVSVSAPGIIAFQIFIVLLTLLNSLVALLSLSFYTVICFVLYKEFEYLCRTLSMKIREDGHFNDDLEKFRIRHQSRCKIVWKADQIFKYYIANTYLTNVPLLCLLLYSTVYTEADYNGVIRFISIFRLMYVLLQMLILSVIATMINNQAHAPLDDLHSIRVVSCTMERQLEIGMFLNKLTGTTIGLTAWDMFVINKPTVLTVVGMILTYFFLLMQFRSPLQGTTACNCLCQANVSEA